MADNQAQTIQLPTAYDILTAVFPPVSWVIPDCLPIGLTILAGKPKLGKSWLALQWALSVSTGGMVFGKRVDQGPVLYLALEDSKQRLQQRMNLQAWPGIKDLPVNILTMPDFRKFIGFLHHGGCVKLQNLIMAYKYRLVIVDTLSKAFMGIQDINDNQEVTRALSPVQELAVSQNCAVTLIDHHTAKPKANGFQPNPIADVMSSTAKSAISDTIMGFYREDSFYRLMMIGREVEEKSINLRFDRLTHAWQLADIREGKQLTICQKEAIEFIGEAGRVKLTAIANACKQDPGNMSRQLKSLLADGILCRDEETKEYYLPE